MKTEIFVCSVVFPNQDTVFLYESNSDIKTFYDTVIDANVSQDALNRAEASIKEMTGAKDVSVMKYQKTMMLTLDSVESLKARKITNIDEMIEPSGQYEPITQLNAIKQDLSKLRNVPFSDMILCESMKIDGNLELQMYVIAIHAPSDWDAKSISLTQRDAQSLEQARILNSMDDMHEGTKTDDLMSQVLRQGIGSVRGGTIQRISDLERTINPYEQTLLTMIKSGMKRNFTNKTSITSYEMYRYLPLAELGAVIDDHGRKNVKQLLKLENNKLILNVSTANRITDSNYLESAKQENGIKYDSGAFKTTDEKAIIIYAPPGSGKTFFLKKNALLPVVLDTDYSSDQLNANIIITNRSELLSRYSETAAIVYDENEWITMVRSKIPGDNEYKNWYQDMVRNTSKAKYIVKASRGKFVSDYISVNMEGETDDHKIVLRRKGVEVPYTEPDADNEPTKTQKQDASKVSSAEDTDAIKLTKEQSLAVDAIGTNKVVNAKGLEPKNVKVKEKVNKRRYK